MFSRVLFIIVAILGLTPRALGQAETPCEAKCTQNSSSCHYQRSQVLLTGHGDMPSSCLTEFGRTVEKMSQAARLVQAVAEIDEAISGLPPQSSLIPTYELEKASALTALGGIHLQRQDVQAATESFAHSADIYRKLLGQPGNANDLKLRIAAGFLRCGRPLEALEVLKHLPTGNTERMYLRAEILFALGERKAAASEYERWIASGCSSRLSLFSDDEFGEKWTFTLPRAAHGSTRCEQLPAELRSRLDTLKTEYGHPGNLPEKNFPAEPFPARIQ